MFKITFHFPVRCLNNLEFCCSISWSIQHSCKSCRMTLGDLACRLRGHYQHPGCGGQPVSGLQPCEAHDRHDDVIKWKHFWRYWPLCGEFTGHRWIPCTKTSDAELWCFLWSAPWINGWVNNREAGDLRRQRAHYDAIIMKTWNKL